MGPAFIPFHVKLWSGSPPYKSVKSTLLLLLGDLNTKHPRWDELSSPNACVAGKFKRACNFFNKLFFLNRDLTQLCFNDLSLPRHATLQMVLRALFSISLRRIALTLSKTSTSVTLSQTTVGSKSRSALTRRNISYVTYLDYAKADWEGLYCALSRASHTASMQGTSNVNTASVCTIGQFGNLPLSRDRPLHSNTHTRAPEQKQTLDDSSPPSTTLKENLTVQTSTSHSMP